MRRRKLSKYSSKKIFKRSAKVNGVNRINPRNFRGGIRL